MVAWPGGEPLWNVPKDIVIFSALRGRPNTVLNRRLPQRPHAMLCPWFRPEIVYPHDISKHLTRVETFPGAACLTRLPVYARAKTNVAGPSVTFQSGSPPGLRRAHPSRYH